MPSKRIPLEVRFWAKVDKTPTCWFWTGAINGHGYGHIKIDGRMLGAHRVSYELAGRSIPEGLTLDHLCRVRHCVNPAHLEPVTRGVNSLRGVGPLAQKARQTHCLRGHEFTPENTYVWKTGRICRACRQEYSREYYRRRKAG